MNWEKALNNSNNFKEFLQTNKEELIEYAEGMTGEQIDGQEPLLTMEEVERMARDIWDECWGKYENEEREDYEQ